jgi:microcystin-dependent protein
MAEGFVGEIRMVSFNYAPSGWALCDGQLLPLNQNQMLFSLLGTTYGGDGVSTFALPDFRSRGPIHQGQGPGLSDRTIGEKGGMEQETLPYAAAEVPQQPDNPMVLNYVKGGMPVSMMQPFLVVNFIICLKGVFPQQS